MKFLLPIIISAFLFQNGAGPGVAMDLGDEKGDDAALVGVRSLREEPWVNFRGLSPIEVVEALWWGNPAEQRPFPIAEAAQQLLRNGNHIDYLGHRKFGVVFGDDKAKVFVFNRDNPGQNGYQIIHSLPAPGYSPLIPGNLPRALVVLVLRDNILQTCHPVWEEREFDLGLPRTALVDPQIDLLTSLLETHLDANEGYIETLNGLRLALSFSRNYVRLPGGPEVPQSYQVRLDRYRLHNQIKKEPVAVIMDLMKNFNLFFNE